MTRWYPPLPHTDATWVSAPVAVPTLPTRQIRVTRLSTLQPKQPTWLLRDRIPYGALTVLAGQPGGGKSTFCIRLAADLSCAGVGSLFVGDEDGAEDTVLPRLLAAGGDPAMVGLVDLERDLMLQLPTDIPALKAKVLEGGAALIVIDPIQAHFAEEINANVDASIRQATRPLARMAQQTGAAVVLVTHDRKSNEGSMLNRIAGSRGMTGSARSVLLFGKAKNIDPWEGADLRFAAHIKCNGAPLAATQRWRIQGEVVRAGGLSINTSQILLEGDARDVSARDLE
jgi:predicted ATP-dependent serine protease